ncbi:MAG: outer membrane beta-barrel protein [Chitinophagaceae bacterium]
MKKLLLLAVQLLLITQAFSQDGVAVRGEIKNHQGLALPDAVVSLHRLNDSALIKAVLTNISGQFTLDNVRTGNYLVKITHVSYETIWVNDIAVAETGLTLAGVALQPKSGKLTEVIVAARRAVVDQKIDATVINITELVRKEAPNAFEVLRFAPNVNLSDNEDAIEMSGKNLVEVMLNGKLVRLSGRDLVKLLKSIPSSSVTQVDVMSNPSSKYDVQGNTGIINIKVKRTDVGMNGNLSVSHTEATNYMGDLSANLNYGVGKWYFTSYTAYHYGKYQTKTQQDRLAGSLSNPFVIDRDNVQIDKWSDPVLRLGADWFISKKHTIGALVEMEKSTNTASYNTITNIGKLNAGYDSSIFTVSNSPNQRKWNTYNLNYRFEDTLGSEFNFDIDRSYYNKNDDNTITNVFRKSGLSSDGPNNIFRTKTITDITTFKADYVKSYKSKLKIEAGAKVSFVSTDNNQLAQFMSTGQVKTDTSRTNAFIYDERIQAVYGSVSKSFRQWGLQAGLRVENTVSDGLSTNLKNVSINKPDTSYLNVLPSLFLSFSPNKNNNFRFSFVQRIERPAYEDLQPFDYQVDQFFYHLGNPSLTVQKNTNLELNYVFKNKLNVGASYVHTTDYFTSVLFQQQGILYERIENAGQSKNFNLNISYPIRPTKWWSAENRVTIFNNRFEGPLFEGYLDAGRWSYTLYTSQRFTLPGQNILRVTARYSAPKLRLYMFDQESGSLSASIGRQVLNKKGILRVGASDVFLTQRRITKVDFGTLRYTEKSTWESRSVFVEFSLRFGSNKIKGPRERNTGNADERGRTK